MAKSTPSFTINVDGVKGTCEAGDRFGRKNMEKGNIPVLACEGGCIKGDVARIAANMVGREEPYRRACHGEIMSIPYSSQSEWAKKAEKVVIIDGCFLKCHGRMLANVTGKESLIQFDALAISKKYADLYEIDAVPEEERIVTARMVADTVLARLKGETVESAESACHG